MLTSWRNWRMLGGLVLVLILAGCQSFLYESQPPPPSPPPPVAPLPPPSRAVYYVNASRLNLRAGPGMDFPKVMVLERNEALEMLGQAEDWAQVRVQRDGTLGWVSNRYLSATPVPVEAPLPPGAETVQPARPPLPPKPTPPERAKPAEAPVPPARLKVEEEKPAKPVKARVEEEKPTRPVKEAEAKETAPAPRKPAAPATPVEAAKPAPREPAPPPKPVEQEKPAPPAEEPKKPIRIM